MEMSLVLNGALVLTGCVVPDLWLAVVVLNSSYEIIATTNSSAVTHLPFRHIPFLLLLSLQGVPSGTWNSLLGEPSQTCLFRLKRRPSRPEPSRTPSSLCHRRPLLSAKILVLQPSRWMNWKIESVKELFSRRRRPPHSSALIHAKDGPSALKMNLTVFAAGSFEEQVSAEAENA